VNVDDIKKKDTEIAELKKKIQDLECDLYAQKCDLDNTKAQNYTFYKLNKELKDKLEEYSLTHYDKKDTVEKTMEERMTAPPAFDYTPFMKPGKRAKPDNGKSNPPSPKKRPSAILESSEDEETAKDIVLSAKKEEYLLESDDELFADNLELLSNQQQTKK
jgi:hypothetical protein